MVIYIYVRKQFFDNINLKIPLSFLNLVLKLLFICTIFLIVSGGKAEPRPSLFIDKYCHYTLHIQTSRALYTLQCMCIVYTSIHTVYCGVLFYLVILPANTYCNGQCHEISNAFIWSKNDFKKFFELLKIFINFTFHNADTVMAYSHRLHGVSRVVDYMERCLCSRRLYADTMSLKSSTTLKQVLVVIDYAEMVSRTPCLCGR